MKTRFSHSLNYIWESCLIAIALTLFFAISTAEAQNNPPKISNAVLNGLFTPNAAQRFFETGRKDFEQEIKFLGNAESYFDGNLLQINPKLLEQIKNNQQQNINSDHWLKKMIEYNHN